jgi:hypothetical protein
MRRELVASVTQLFNAPRPDPLPLDKESNEFRRLNRMINLVVRLRGATERDHYSRELQNIYGAEGTGRIGLALERLLAGLDTLGVPRTIALGVVIRVALDSTPPVRRSIYTYLCTPLPGMTRKDPLPQRTTTDVSNKLGLPAGTVRRNLEDLAGYGLVQEQSQGPGRASLWQGVIVP